MLGMATVRPAVAALGMPRPAPLRVEDCETPNFNGGMVLNSPGRWLVPMAVELVPGAGAWQDSGRVVAGCPMGEELG